MSAHFCFLLLLVTIATITFTEASFDGYVGSKQIETHNGPINVSLEEYMIQDGKDKQKLLVGMKIPYAAPPIKSKRFMPPQNHSSWINATNCDRSKLTELPACHQSKVFDWNKENRDVDTFWMEMQGGGGGISASKESEDCLYLNVWAPADKNGDVRDELMPVLFFIHGGQFQYDTAFNNLYEGTPLALGNNLVVVTFNYRLGPLGFFAHTENKTDNYYDNDDPEAHGNAGLMDMALALHWVHSNIERFGGDKDNVTLYGSGTGAAAAQYLMVSKHVPEYHYNRAILSSGAMGGHMTFQEPKMGHKMALDLLNETNCLNDNGPYKNDLECLQYRNVDRIVKHSVFTLKEDQGEFLPTTDKHFFPYSPKKALDRLSRHNHKDLLFGFNKDEGSFEMAEYRMVDRDVSATEGLAGRDFDDGVKLIVPEAKRNGKVMDLIREEYFDYSKRQTQDLTNFVSDFLYKCDIAHAAQMLSKSNKGVITYRFDASFNFSTKAYKYYGAGHGLELIAVWGRPYVNETLYNSDEQMLSYFVSNVWKNFVTGGRNSLYYRYPNKPIFVMDEGDFSKGYGPEWSDWRDEKCHFVKCIPDFENWFSEKKFMKDHTCKKYVPQPPPTTYTPDVADGSSLALASPLLLTALLAATIWFKSE